MEQYKLDFSPERKPETAKGEPALEGLGYDNLIDLYHEKIGKDPSGRAFTRGRLIEGINRGKERELEALAEEDKESDEGDLISPYKGRK